MHKSNPLLLILLVMATSLTTSTAQNLKVFILAGQSNMQGHGDIEPEDIFGTLSHFIANDGSGMFDHVQNPDGSWATRDDVWVRYDHENGQLLADVLGVGYGGWEGQIGPELGFGHLLGEYCEEQVLLVKTCWGGKNLAVDFRPPSSGGAVGPYYSQMINDVNAAMENVASEFPQYSGENIELAGFCWFQGWNDGEQDAYLQEYEENLKNLIMDLRTEFNTPDLPVVIGLTGNGGFDIWQNDLWVQSLQTILVPAQINAAEYTGYTNVTYAETRGFHRDESISPFGAIHHWNNNAESYLRIGHEMGLRMLELLDQNSTSTTEASNLNIRIFPNPVESAVQITGLPASVSIQLLNLDGRLVRRVETLSSQGELELQDLPTGMYFLEVLDAKSSRIAIQKFIKQ